MISEELLKLKEHETSLEAFLVSRAYRGFLSARKEEIRVIEDTILEVDPVTREEEVEQMKARGERRCLRSMLTAFPDALEEVKDRIADLEDEEEAQSPRTETDEIVSPDNVL
jgi:hypothetical protein